MHYDFETKPDRINSGSVKYLRAPSGALPFTIADSDFITAPAIRDALEDKLKYKDFGYMFPGPELTKCFTDWFERTYDYSIPAEWVLPVSGVVPALSVASQVRSGKSIMNIPNYGMMLSAPVKAGREVIEVPMKSTHQAEGIVRWEIDFTLLEDSVTEDTSFFCLCNPHNPVGRVYTRDELQKLSNFARRHDLIIVSDEIHCELVYEDAHIPFITVDAYAREHTILLTAPGKTFSIPGIGGAFALIPNAALRESFQRAAYALGHPNMFSAAALMAAYRDSDEWKNELIQYLRENRDYLENEIKRRFPLAEQTHVEGTYLAWINFKAYIDTDRQDKWLAEHANVLFHSAEFFHWTDHIRWNFATQKADLTSALDRLEEALSK